MTVRYATLFLAALMLLVFFADMAAGGLLTDNLLLVSADVQQRPWTLVTYMFVHDGLAHIGYNLFALLIFGLLLEDRIGSGRFLAVFFGCGLAAGFASMVFYEASLGASGAIMGVIGAVAALRPRLVVWNMGVPMPMVVAAAVWAGLDLLGFASLDNVAHAAHLAGLALGIAAGLWMRPELGDRAEKRERPPEMDDRKHEEWEREYMGR
jgi:membrane associated rhomboid family serine protease